MKEEELIRVLVSLSRSDDDFNAREFAYILDVAVKLGMDKDRFEALVRDQAEPEWQSPPSEHERMRIFYYLLFLMKIDREVRDEEKDMIHYFGFQLGFNRAMINDFVDLVSEYKDERLPEQEMLDIIRKYNN